MKCSLYSGQLSVVSHTGTERSPDHTINSHLITATALYSTLQYSTVQQVQYGILQYSAIHCGQFNVIQRTFFLPLYNLAQLVHLGLRLVQIYFQTGLIPASTQDILYYRPATTTTTAVSHSGYPPQDSETGWTGEVWSKTNILN